MILEAQNSFIEGEFSKDRDEILEACKKYNIKEMDEKIQIPVYYDAWENDNDNDPILSIVYCIIENLSIDEKIKLHENKLFEIVKAATVVSDIVSGKRVSELLESFKNTKNEDLIDEIKKQKNLREEINRFLNEVIIGRGNRLVLFIDELDRCKPDFSIKLLERIKHYFNNDNVTFVFSVNLNELKHSIKKYYGESFDGYRYLDRFFDLRIGLQKVDMKAYCANFGFSDSWTYDKVALAFIEQHDMEMREVSRYLQLLKIAAYNPTHNNQKYNFIFSDGKGLEYSLLLAVPIIIGLFVTDSEKYNDFIQGKDVTPLKEVFLNRDNGAHYFNAMLENKQTFADSYKDMQHVELETIIDEFYNALFVEKFDYRNYEKKLGKLTFDKNTRIKINQVSKMLSEYTQLD